MGASIGKGSKDGPSHHVAGAGVAVYSIWASPREPNRIRWGDTTSERENREGESGNKVCVGCCCLHLNVQRQWRPAGRERESQSCNRPPELLLLCCPWDQQIATKHNSAAAEKFSANRNIWSPAQLTQRSLYLWHLASCVLAARSFDWASYSSCLHIRSWCSICLPPVPFSLLPFFFLASWFFLDDPIHGQKSSGANRDARAGLAQPGQNQSRRDGRLEKRAAVRPATAADQPERMPHHPDTIRRIRKSRKSFSSSSSWLLSMLIQFRFVDKQDVNTGGCPISRFYIFFFLFPFIFNQFRVACGGPRRLKFCSFHSEMDEVFCFPLFWYGRIVSVSNRAAQHGEAHQIAATHHAGHVPAAGRRRHVEEEARRPLPIHSAHLPSVVGREDVWLTAAATRNLVAHAATRRRRRRIRINNHNNYNSGGRNRIHE